MSGRQLRLAFSASSSSSCLSFPSCPSSCGCATSSPCRRQRRGCGCGCETWPPSSPPQTATHADTPAQPVSHHRSDITAIGRVLVQQRQTGRDYDSVEEKLPWQDPARRPSLFWLLLVSETVRPSGRSAVH